MGSRIDKRREQVERLHGLLAESVEAVQSSEDWNRLLDFAGRFHHYSFDNQLLIAVQHDQAFRAGRVTQPLPTYVAGFHTWKALGRSVERGQRGYAILAPVSSRTRLARGADGTTRALDRRDDVGDDAELLRGPVVLRGFTVAHVWDVTQTSGAPIPEPPRPQLLEGVAPNGLAEQLTAFLISREFDVAFVSDADAIGGANGVTDFAARTVRVRADMHGAAQVKTLAHETGHVLLHDPSADPDVTTLGLGHRGRAEVEAESVAYVVTSAYGMDPSAYSLPYVTSWAGTDKPAEVVRTTARRVVNAAQQVLGSLDLEQTTGGQPPGVSRALERRSAEREARSPAVAAARAHEAIAL
jgi:hypothetical protein